MGEKGYDVYRYSYIAVFVFGILGNILVVISILRRKNALKNNYYFLVLHLAICDLRALIFIFFLGGKDFLFFKQTVLYDTIFDHCLSNYVSSFFQVSGIGMMLMISVLRYRATVHPLKPAISRRKLKLVCGLVYIVGFIAGYGPAVPSCLLIDLTIYNKYHYGYMITCFYSFPTIFMAVVYFKIARALMNQNKFIKSVCSNPAVRRSPPSSSFNILTFFRNRKTFLVCLFTVLCYAVGNIPWTVLLILDIAEQYILRGKYFWIEYCAGILRVAGMHSANPLIYGILDKKLFKFWKRRSTRKRRTPEH